MNLFPESWLNWGSLFPFMPYWTIKLEDLSLLHKLLRILFSSSKATMNLPKQIIITMTLILFNEAILNMLQHTLLNHVHAIEE